MPDYLIFPRFDGHLIRFCGSGKVFDDKDEAGFHIRVQARGRCSAGEQWPATHADRDRAGDLSLHAEELAGPHPWSSTPVQSYIQPGYNRSSIRDLTGRSGGGNRAVAARAGSHPDGTGHLKKAIGIFAEVPK